MTKPAKYDLVARLREGRTEGMDLRWHVSAIHNEAADRIANLEAALRKIASCEKRADGDVVDIARKALNENNP